MFSRVDVVKSFFLLEEQEGIVDDCDVPKDLHICGLLNPDSRVLDLLHDYSPLYSDGNESNINRSSCPTLLMTVVILMRKFHKYLHLIDDENNYLWINDDFFYDIGDEGVFYLVDTLKKYNIYLNMDTLYLSPDNTALLRYILTKPYKS